MRHETHYTSNKKKNIYPVQWDMKHTALPTKKTLPYFMGHERASHFSIKEK